MIEEGRRRGWSPQPVCGWVALGLLTEPPLTAEDPMRLDRLTDRPRRTRHSPWHMRGRIIFGYLVAATLVSGCATSTPPPDSLSAITLGKVLLTDSFDNPAAG